MAYNCLFFMFPDGSTRAALANLLFDPTEHNIHILYIFIHMFCTSIFFSIPSFNYTLKLCTSLIYNSSSVLILSNLILVLSSGQVSKDVSISHPGTNLCKFLYSRPISVQVPLTLFLQTRVQDSSCWAASMFWQYGKNIIPLYTRLYKDVLVHCNPKSEDSPRPNGPYDGSNSQRVTPVKKSCFL